MNEQFDRALRNHIRDTFDHYDDLMADDGWKKFKQQKNRKKRGLIFWLGLPSGIAAALALLWLFNLDSNVNIKPKNSFIAKNQLSENATPVLPLNKKSIKKIKTDIVEKKHAVNFNKKTSPESLNQYKNNEFVNSYAFEGKQRKQVAIINVPEKNISVVQSEEIQPSFKIVKKLFTNHEPVINNSEYLAFNSGLLNTATENQNAISKTKDTEKKSKILNFSVDANTYYSFTNAGVSNNVNLGLGLQSELKLTNRLSINSGIAINKQTTSYKGDKGSTANNTLALQVSKQAAAVPESVQTNAKLVGFDIPLNLKYNIPLGKAKTFVTTGISSYSLLNQSYSNDLSVINYSLKGAPTTSVLTSVEKQNDGAFSNFQFARTINFSFGILYPVSSKNSISVEPFVKYPLSGFGSQDLEIGSGGISFKLNFGK